MDRRTIRGSLILLLGTVIWGFAFAAQRAGMDHVGPMTFSGVRMLLAGLVMIPVAMMSEKKAAREGKKTDPGLQREAGLLCGMFLFMATSFQQIGLVETDAGKAGFLTALYVVLVPVAGLVFLRKNPGKVIWLGIVLAVIALYLLCVPESGFRVERGDAFLIACALCFTVQILFVDRYAQQVNATALARDEFLVTGGLGLLIALISEEISFSGLGEALVPILYTGIMSGAVGYSIQIIGQRDVNPTLASLLMCMESVFAVLGGALLLGERMSGRNAAGCVMMFIAVLLAQLSPLFHRKKAD